MNDDLNNIEGINDRRNLLLLTYKKVKTADDESMITILSTFYPDFPKNKLGAIRADLVYRGLIDRFEKIPNLSGLDERYNNNFIWLTTDAGETALKTNLFPSEMRKRNEKKKRQINKEDDRIFYKRMSKWSLFISIAALIIALIALFKQ